MKIKKLTRDDVLSQVKSQQGQYFWVRCWYGDIFADSELDATEINPDTIFQDYPEYQDHLEDALRCLQERLQGELNGLLRLVE